MNTRKSLDKLVNELKERAKELNCLYKVQELLNDRKKTVDDVLRGIIEVLPPGWQYPEICQAKIEYQNLSYKSDHYQETPWVLNSDIVIQNEIVGMISVCYTEERPLIDEGPFLKEERKLV